MSEKTFPDYNFYIAGVQHHEGKHIIRELSEGTQLFLEPEPDNKYDPNAIRILYIKHHVSTEEDEKVMLGYVPARFSPSVNASLEIYPDMFCELVEVDPKAKLWEALRVQIQLPDNEDPADENTNEMP